MNKIVREHYPVANLPEDLREGLATDATVKIVVEVEDAAIQNDIGRYPGFKDFPMVERKPMSIADTLEAIRTYKAEGRPSVSVEDAVSRIRELRDEWDD
ncbi:hypothetical protein [Neorhizobium galegae]|uniref:hypothetical protein n=1 Tax=Neorhizobium galegae TaxID=399 RepID=UPI00062263BE|nr:hypothetical protein [Neorhizobium galegae]CDZ57932.1 Hypothetical protein NGAL_HAMBI2566_24880 [Neorhizobium galegae bv. orientalis]KAB1122404.1 hypothetical protein F4V90_21285 [Neorhizobium galegae]MCQ1573788.1 hypothetical protein [Neorhizobium galegae]MCQ1805636.1 hypothetical protein [Neorhizobium galegae]MCQ1834762.1 hypothetical protein [Neorhizobium galegae]